MTQAEIKRIARKALGIETSRGRLTDELQGRVDAAVEVANQMVEENDVALTADALRERIGAAGSPSKAKSGSKTKSDSSGDSPSSSAKQASKRPAATATRRGKKPNTATTAAPSIE
jgi:hypothetical protein